MTLSSHLTLPLESPNMGPEGACREPRVGTSMRFQACPMVIHMASTWSHMMSSVWGALGTVLTAVRAWLEVITTHLSPKFPKKSKLYRNYFYATQY